MTRAFSLILPFSSWNPVLLLLCFVAVGKQNEKYS